MNSFLKFFGATKKKITYSLNTDVVFDASTANIILEFVKAKREKGENFEYKIEVDWSVYESFCEIFKEVIRQKEVRIELINK